MVDPSMAKRAADSACNSGGLCLAIPAFAAAAIVENLAESTATRTPIGRLACSGAALSLCRPLRIARGITASAAPSGARQLRRAVGIRVRLGSSSATTVGGRGRSSDGSILSRHGARSAGPSIFPLGNAQFKRLGKRVPVAQKRQPGRTRLPLCIEALLELGPIVIVRARSPFDKSKIARGRGLGTPLVPGLRLKVPDQKVSVKQELQKVYHLVIIPEG